MLSLGSRILSRGFKNSSSTTKKAREPTEFLAGRTIVSNLGKEEVDGKGKGKGRGAAGGERGDGGEVEEKKERG